MPRLMGVSGAWGDQVILLPVPQVTLAVFRAETRLIHEYRRVVDTTVVAGFGEPPDDDELSLARKFRPPADRWTVFRLGIAAELVEVVEHVTRVRELGQHGHPRAGVRCPGDSITQALPVGRPVTHSHRDLATSNRDADAL
ncbi:MAG: hypothetical protein JWQ68_504 [Cryobacterium sp.]|nr:hypothetical protein [Cryobacterium sp.]